MVCRCRFFSIAANLLIGATVAPIPLKMSVLAQPETDTPIPYKLNLINLSNKFGRVDKLCYICIS
jgi:hypothetical protein